MNKSLMKMVTLLLLSLWSHQSYAKEWTIPVTPDGTQGGYVETADGKPQCDVNYSTTWPIAGYVPVFYIHFPVGTFQITSANDAAIRVNVRDASTGEDKTTNKSARNFSFTSSEEGWYRFQLTGGTPGVTILKDFTVTSSNATGTNANVFLAGWRSMPSLHIFTFGSTDASLPSGNAFDWIYDEVMIPTDADYHGTYAEAFGFKGGYIGIQNNGSNGGTDYRTVIFSSWDNGDTDSDPELADFKRSGVIATGEAEHVTAERFGGEGTGCHIILNGNLWKPGQWVRFLLNTRPEQITLSDGTIYNNTLLSAWYWAEGVDTEWHYIGTIRQSGTTNYFGSNFNAFLEEYTRTNNSQGYAIHKAYYRRIFTRSMQSGTWYNRNQFTWSHTDGGTDDGARNDWYQTALDDFEGEPAIYMQSGGYIDPYTGKSDIPLIKPNGIVPDENTLQQLINQDVEPAIKKQNEDRMDLAMQASYLKLDQTEWTVTDFSSQETGGEGTNGRAAMSIDGDETTYWHTSWWSSGDLDYPHQLTLYHNGNVTIDKICINIPSNRGSNYRPKRAEILTSVNGITWTSKGTYNLQDAALQEIVLNNPVTTSYIKLNFTEGYGKYIVISELELYQEDRATMLSHLQSMAKDYLDRADMFNSYSTEDLQELQAVYNSNSSTLEDYQSALANLVKNGTLLKYGEVTEVAHLSAEKAYYIFNAYGYGAMVAQDGEPTLRNANPIAGSVHEGDCQSQYKAKAKVQDETSNWMILTTDKFPGYYYIYNIGVGKYLNPLYQSELSDTPQPFSISKKNGYYILTAINFKYGSQTQVCLAPQFDSKPISVWNNDSGNYFIIYDNYSLSPSKELINQLRSDIYQAARQQAGTVAVINMSSTIDTYSNAKALDFSNVEGLQAFRATSFDKDNGNVQMNHIAQSAANEGLLLRGLEGEYEVPYIAQANNGTNLLVGVQEDTQISSKTGTYSNFVLNKDNTGKVFIPVVNETISGGKAYLRIPSTHLPNEGINKVSIRFDQDVKGDVNGDGKVDITDAVQLINKILGNPVSPFYFFNADINDDGTININDAVLIVNIILNK